MDDNRLNARDIAESAIKVDNDINGNPRYYIACYLFTDSRGRMVRPRGAVKYRGKRYGAGWIFSSYALESDIQHALDGIEA